MKKTIFSLVSISMLIVTSMSVLSIGQADVGKQSLSSRGEIIEMIEQIDEELVFYYHDRLMDFQPRYTGTITCELAAYYIYHEFKEMGLEVEFHEWKYAGFQSRNVIATLEGTDPASNAVFIMSAHYDTVEVSPGANDDGSGVAAIMAAAKIMSQYSFNHTIKFIAFSGEEVGTYGSFLYAKKAYNRGDNIVAVLNADMVGYADTVEGGKIIRFFHPERSTWIADYAITIGEKYLDLIDLSVESLPNYMGADHQAFVYYGYDGVWIAHHDGYQWGHSPEDTPDHINWTYQVKATKFLLACMAELALKPIDVQIILESPLEGYGHFFNRRIRELPFGKRWAKGLRGLTIILGRALAIADVRSNEEVKRVIFCIDGDFISWDSEPPYEWKIQGRFKPLRGKHILKVYAYTESGKVATDEMDMLIFTRSYLYQRR